MSVRRVAGCAFLLDVAFSDSDVVDVAGWFSAVIEGWAACFLDGSVVVFWLEAIDVGELVVAEIALHSDPERVVGQLRFGMQSPFVHFVLAFSMTAAADAGD